LKKLIKIILINILLVSGFILTAQDFTAFIKAESGGEFTYLTFGFNPDATDEFDDGLDEEAENAPDTGFDVALEWGGDRYLTQILQGDDDYSTHEYLIRFQFPESGDIVLTWDNTNLSGVGEFTIKDPLGGFFINANMLTETSVTVNNPVLHNPLTLSITPIDGGSIPNRAPYAHAGSDISTVSGLAVQLDASESYDPE